MMIPIQFVFSDGRNCTISVEEGGSILAASREQGLTPLVDCEEGICGTCQARVSCGTVAMDEYSEGVLSESEIKDSMVLVCRSRATCPAVIELPYSSSDALMQEQEHPISASVVEVQEVSSETVSLTVETEEYLHFLPGQYVNISPNESVERSFSMARATGTRQLGFYIGLRPDGQFSSWLRRAEVGMKVRLSSARGTFYLRGDGRPKLMIAGGTGLAPFLSMLETLAGRSEDERAAPIRLLIGARSDNHLFELETVARLREHLPRLDFEVACDEVAAGSPLRKGRVTELLEEIEIDPAATVYACGPPPMVEAVRQALKRRRFPIRQFLAEKFTG